MTKGFGFLLIFTGFLTISSTADTILRSYKSRNPGSGDLNGLLSQEWIKMKIIDPLFERT